MSGATTSTASAPANKSFTEKLISVKVQLGQGSFGSTGQNTATLPFLRTALTISKHGAPSMDRATLRVYGMAPSLMNQLSTIGTTLPNTLGRNNIVTISAGDTVNGMGAIFTGTTQNAWKDLTEAPESSFLFDLQAGGFDAMKPADPISYPGASDAATIMAGIAAKAGWIFENGGVQVRLMNRYYPGTAFDQANACAQDGGFEMYLDGQGASRTLAIWPAGGSRGGAIPLVSSDSGLLRYPRYASYGMDFTCLFNPSIRVGGKIEMKSTADPPADQTIGSGVTTVGTSPSLNGANGIWFVRGLTVNLASKIKNGPWDCDVKCARLGGPEL